ncbi:TPA: hypothetical protein ACH3X1_011588 [Trebouxia sp. C0004]
MVSQSGAQKWDADVHNHVQLCVRVDLNPWPKLYTQPFKDRFWLQQIIQVQTAEGPAETRACIRDLDDSLRKALHDKHRLGQSNQDSLYFQLWDKVQPFRVKPHSDALWTTPSIPESHKRNIFKYRTGQVWNKNMAFKRHMPYMPGAANSQRHTLPDL